VDSYPLGQPIRVPITVKDVNGALATPGALTLRLYKDGTLVQTYSSPTLDGTGLYHVDIPITDLATVGRYRTIPTATGLNAGVDFDVFDVFDPATFPRIVSFADAKNFLRLQGTADDALLDRMVGWASARILMEVEAYRRTHTQRVTCRDGRTLRLSHVPVQTITSITAVTPYSPAVAASSLYVTSPMGGTVEAYGAYLVGTYDVVYVAGYDEVQPGVDGAVLQLVQHWWNQSQAHGSSTYGDAGFIPDFAGLPNSVKNMLGSASRPPLFA
jgi:hypothetical protein